MASRVAGGLSTSSDAVDFYRLIDMLFAVDE